MSPPKRAPLQPALFDLPLSAPVPPDSDEPPASPEAPVALDAAADLEAPSQATPAAAPPARQWSRPASWRQRALAGLGDLVVHVAVLAGGATLMALLSLEPRAEDWPGLAAFVLAFSFLYTVVPLAFWGQTPGMAWSDVKATDEGGRPLTLGQTALRWLGGLLTAALLGIPLLPVFRGRSLTDVLSGSSCQARPPEPV